MSSESFDSAISLSSSLSKAFQVHHLHQPIRPSQGSQMTVRSLLRFVAGKPADSRLGKVQRRVHIPDIPWKEGEDDQRPRPEVVVTDKKSDNAVTNLPRFAVHNINRETKFLIRPMDSSRRHKSRPQSELRFRLNFAFKGLQKAEIQRNKIEKKRPSSHMQVQGNRCSYSHRPCSSVSLHPEPPAHWPVTVSSPSPVLRPSIKSGMKRTPATASFTVFDSAALEKVGKKAYSSFERSRSSRGFNA